MNEDENVFRAAVDQADHLRYASLAPISVTVSTAVGALMIVSATAFAAMNVIVIRALLTAKELIRLSSYKFIIAMSVADFLQLCVQLFAGFLTVFRTSGHETVNRFMSALNYSAYLLFMMLTIVLAINRLTVVISERADRFLFSTVGVTFWLVICTTIAIPYTALMLTPTISVFYFWQMLSFNTVYSLPDSYRFSMTKGLVERCGAYIISVLYTLMFAVIIYKRRTGNTKNIVIDAKILIQSTVISVTFLVLNVFWFYYEKFISATIAGYAFLNFLWILNCAVNPIVYMVLNGTMRQKITSNLFSSSTQMYNEKFRGSRRQQSLKDVNRRLTNIMVVVKAPPKQLSAR